LEGYWAVLLERVAEAWAVFSFARKSTTSSIDQLRVLFDETSAWVLLAHLFDDAHEVRSIRLSAARYLFKCVATISLKSRLPEWAGIFFLLGLK
jgi:hypothetical protein